MEVLSPYCGLLPLSQNDCPTSSIFVVPKWLSGLSAWLKIWGLKSNHFVPNFYYQEVIWDYNFRGCFGVVVYSYFKNHTYNYSVIGQRALILPKLGTWTIILGRRKYSPTLLVRHLFIWHPRYYETFLRDQTFWDHNSLFYTTTTLNNTTFWNSILSY